jgi:hypothetical protein
MLYAPQLQTQRIPTVGQMQLKKAHTLVLGAGHPDPLAPMPPRKKEKERLLETVQAMIKEGQWPVLVTEPVSTAQELTKLLTDHDIPVAVHDAIFKVHNVYEAYGSKLGSYTRYSKKHSKQKVTLFPLPNKKTILLRSALPDGPVIYVENTAEETAAPTAFGAIAARFHVGSTCDGPEIKEVVAAVSPRELYIFGPYAKRYVEAFEGLCPVVKPLFVNDQPTLF